MTYRIETRYFDGREPDIIEEEVTLEEAQAHCSSPATSGPGWMDVFYNNHDED